MDTLSGILILYRAAMANGHNPDPASTCGLCRAMDQVKEIAQSVHNLEAVSNEVAEDI